MFIQLFAKASWVFMFLVIAINVVGPLSVLACTTQYSDDPNPEFCSDGQICCPSSQYSEDG